MWLLDLVSHREVSKVKGQASPFDGNLLYWAKRLKDHPLTKTTLGKLLQKQQGKCRWCELLFWEEDQIEIDHITPKSEGGGEELSNKFALHRHCHDQRHAKHDRVYHEQRTALLRSRVRRQVSRTVLEPSGGGDPFA